MKHVASLLKKVFVDAAEITADADRLRMIADDLRTSGGPLTPMSNWVTLDPSVSHNDDGREWLDRSFSTAAVDARMSTMDKMLAPWIGSIQMSPAVGEASDRFRPWLAHHDPLSLWKANFEDLAVASRLSAADLGSAMDLNLLWSFTANRDDPTVLLEVGGGYGRLAEAALNVFGDVKHVLVDGVPASLLYANDYLRRACPDARVGFYYDGDAFDMTRFDCYIVPSWHFEAVNTAVYDACVNIESFQEMRLQQVQGFLDMFDRLSRQGSVIYISNFQDAGADKPTDVLAGSGRWHYPDSWRQVFCSNSPRSTTPDHPAEVFVKEDGDWSTMNAQMGAAQHWAAALRRRAVPQSLPAESLQLARRASAAAGRRLGRLWPR